MEELAGELGGVGHTADMTARQLGHAHAEDPAQFRGDVVRRVAAPLPPGCQDDPVGTGPERVEVELNGRILAQLVLEPVGGVGVIARGTRHDLPVCGGEGPVAEPGQCRLDPGFTVQVVDLGEEVDPLLPVGQEPHGGRLKGDECPGHGRVVGEDRQGDDRPGAGAEDDRGLVAQVLDQAPDVVGIGLQPAAGVLRRFEPAA